MKYQTEIHQNFIGIYEGNMKSLILDKKEVVEIKDLHSMIVDSFALAEKKKVRLWGVYPLVNPFYMQMNISFDLRYIIACMMGFVNTHDDFTFCTMNDKEDFERSIKFYIKDGGVMRYNYIGALQSPYKERGGMQEHRTPKRIRNSALELLQKYPMFCSVNTVRLKKHFRKGNPFEIRLRDKRKKKPITSVVDNLKEY